MPKPKVSHSVKAEPKGMQRGDDCNPVWCADEQQIGDALYEMLEGCFDEVTVKDAPLTSTSAAAAVDVDLFSTKVKEEYLKSEAERRSHKSWKPQKNHNNKKSHKRAKMESKGSKDTSDSSSSSEEEDLEMLASIAVSASDLSTSNKVLQLTNQSTAS